jgi:uncharacterized YigZ family protein
MRVLIEAAEREIEVRKSRFIAIAVPIIELEEIKGYVERTRNEHPNAAHVVHAAVVGPTGGQFSYSDDREPRNTAGRPALEVLKGSGITNILILIIRYFGGTLLGTGGLVKAYGDSVKAVLEVVNTEELIERVSFSYTIPYSLYEIASLHLVQVEATVEKENFDVEVTVTGILPTSRREELSSYISNISNGQRSVSFIDE